MKKTALLLSLMLLLSACALSPARQFAEWRNGFVERAVEEGVSPAILAEALPPNMIPDKEVLRLAVFQPEFVKPIWKYLETAISPLRVKNGKSRLDEEQALLVELQEKYGVDKHILVAIWGLETNYGTYLGDMNIIRSLATLAFEGKRQNFAEQQLIAALKIIESGDVSLADMRGSWAGAMGHTQFIPTTYLMYGVDYDGDGRRNIWQSKADALASAAYYLKKSGWKAGKGWGGEVVLPKDFDLSFISTSIKKPLAEWERLGVAPIGSLENIGRAYLYLPAGLRGPVFLLGENFRAILRYNHSHAYGIGVGQLASVLGGGPHFSTDWPDSEAATLRLQEVEELQSLLTKKGFDTKGVDGRIGPATLAAVRKYQKAKGLIADGYIDKALLAHLRGR